MRVKNNFNTRFLEYGDLGGIVSEKNRFDALVYVQFLDDAFADNTADMVSKSATDYLDRIVSLIETRCKESTEPFVFAFSCWSPKNVIRSAKRQSERRKLNIWFFSRLEEVASEYSSFYFLNLDECFGDFGLTKCLEPRNWYFAHARMSSLGYEVIADAVGAILTRHVQPAHKVLVLDCDNTLWGGVIGEDDIGRLELGTDGVGKAFLDFQRMIMRLKNDGVLIAIVSKNNEEDVWKIFDTHESMVLSRSDIVASKINWLEKSGNIYDLSQELNLDASSFVFWDDNPIEREKAKLMLPTMHTVDVPLNVWVWPSLIGTLKEFSKFNLTEEDQNKTSLYKSRSQFISSKMESLDEVSFLRSIELCAELVPFGENNRIRAVQLCQKTNQFNLTSRRHSEEALQSIASENMHYCSVASLKDRFGNHGLVGLFCLCSLNENDLYIDSFLLSCRVLGRQFEVWMMSQIIKIAQANGFARIIGEFIPSNKNSVAEKFLEDCGFSRLAEILPVTSKYSGKSNSGNILYSRNLAPLANFDQSLYEN